MIFANGFKSYFLTALFEASSIAAAPSLRPDELPAVTVPFSLNTVLNFERISMDV
ncbi:MAG: hypothetical protein CM15mP112_09200 [Flavobacteriales bacterium]|nr:MAG: hypothetical protein CM15mP112_09200 [Flavobacteriales bacterium]